jgi:hypothetical protein
MTAKIIQVAFGVMGVLFAGSARGDSIPVVADVPPEGQPVAVAPAPYSLPWGLPLTFASTGVRLDNSFAFSHDATDRNVFTVTSIFGASYRIRPGVAVVAKLAWVDNQPATGDAQTTMANPALGASLALPLGNGFICGGILSVAIPVGMGGGNSPDPNTQAANRAGTYTRSALDQALFTPNYLTLVPCEIEDKVTSVMPSRKL